MNQYVNPVRRTEYPKKTKLDDSLIIQIGKILYVTNKNSLRKVKAKKDL